MPFGYLLHIQLSYSKIQSRIGQNALNKVGHCILLRSTKEYFEKLLKEERLIERRTQAKWLTFQGYGKQNVFHRNVMLLSQKYYVQQKND